MLDPWIIEEIRRREEEQRRERQAPTIEVPLQSPRPEGERERGKPAGEGDSPRGVVVIDF